MLFFKCDLFNNVIKSFQNALTKTKSDHMLPIGDTHWV